MPNFSEKLAEMGYRNYDEYLRSERWKKFRTKYFRSKRAKTCACCAVANFAVELHHRTYDRLGKELLTDVVPLCREHHEAVHELLKVRYGGAVEWTGRVIASLSLKKRSGRSTRVSRLHIPDNVKWRNKQGSSEDFTE